MLQDVLDPEKCRGLLKEALQATRNCEDLYLQKGQGTGAAVLTRSGKIYRAGHKSRASGNKTHAEVLALNISIEADNKDPIIALALISSNPKAKDMHWYPCGHCRQEFIDHLLYLRKNGLVDSDYDITIICGRPDLTYKTHSLKELLPYSWEPADKGD